MSLGTNSVKISIVGGVVILSALTLVLYSGIDFTTLSITAQGVEIERTTIEPGEMVGLRSATDEIPCNIVSLSEVKLSATKVKPGDTLLASYTICNPNRTGDVIALGMSLQSYSKGYGEIIDPKHDQLVSLVEGVHTYQRFFVIPEDMEPGSYNVAMAIWEDTPGNEKNFVLGHTGWMKRQMIVTE